VPAAIVRVGGPTTRQPVGSSTGTWAWQNDDWALLRIETPDALQVLPIFEGDPSTAIPLGDPVELVSCFDSGEPAARCHTHPFRFGDRPKELIQGGHSGAPILWRGQMIAIFIGGTADWSAAFKSLWWLRTLTVGSLTPVRVLLSKDLDTGSDGAGSGD
jgi:hypothetical protein